MNPESNEPSRPDRIRDLIRKLQALLNDAAASEGERANARAKLRAVMERHGLTESDLLSDAPRRVVLQYDHKDDRGIVIQIAGEVLDRTRVTFGEIRAQRMIVLDLPAADCADLFEAWSHYRPLVVEARRAATQQQRKLRAEANALMRGFSSAFISRFRIYAPSDSRPPRPLTKAELRALLDAEAANSAIRDIEGDKWRRKAGYVDGSQQFQLT